MIMFEPDFVKQINYTEKSHDEEIRAFDIVYLPGFNEEEDYSD